MKIYLSGQVIGNYRAQNIIKVLSDKNIPFLTTPYQFYLLPTKNKMLNFIFSSVLLLLLIPSRIYYILVSSHLILLPMNWTRLVVFEILLAWLFRKKIIVDYYVSSYDTLVLDRKSIAKNSLRSKFALYLDRIFMSFATRVVFLNQSEATYYQSLAGLKLDSDKVRIIPLCVDLKKEVIEKVFLKNFEIKHIKKTDEFWVCWWGTYIPLHGLENIIRAFALVKGEKTKLFLLGNNEERSKPYKKIIDELGLAHKVSVINDFTFVNGKLGRFLINNCDLALGSFGASEKAKTVLVNKIVDSLALSLPCLTVMAKASNEFLTDGHDVVYTDSSPESIAFTIDKLAGERETLVEIGVKGYSTYTKYFSPDSFRISLLELLEELK